MKEVEEFLREKRKSSEENTITAYRRDLNDFVFEFAGGDPERVYAFTEREIYDYIHEAKDKLSGVSLCRRISVLRSFYAFLLQQGKVDRNPMQSIRGRDIDKKAPDILTVKEVQKLLKVPDEGGAKGIRNRAMLEILYATGMRVTEMISLNLGDLNLEAGIVTCSEDKRRRSIALYDVAVRELRDYLEFSRPFYCSNPEESALFVNSTGGRMTRQGFWKILKACAEEAGIDRSVSPHTLRHSFAAHLLENGANARRVQEIMGNSDGTSIKVYVKYLKSKAKDDVIALHPRAKVQKWDY